MIHREIATGIDHGRLLDDIHRLDIMGFVQNNNNQMAVQHRGLADKRLQLLESCQSLKYDWDRYDQSRDADPPVRDVELEETLFTETCDFFRGTYVGEVIDGLRRDFGAYRGRFMLMRFKTCLSMHRDYSPRLHVPIITNPDCFMVVDDQVCRLPSGASYLVDTRLPHTAINSGKKDRLHLVFCVSDF